MSFVFFTPCEELNGTNIFAKLSDNYNVIQPYLDIIDREFIDWINNKVYNIARIVKPSRDRNSLGYDSYMNEGSTPYNDYQGSASGKTQESNEVFGNDLGKVHMYQPDISNKNAIDYAFQKNAIFCIKAFVDTLLILSDENQFRNCFDRALLLMIERGLDVKSLVNSSLFYP